MKIKRDVSTLMLIHNKKLPAVWRNKSGEQEKIIRKILSNENIYELVKESQKNKVLQDLYNAECRRNYSKIMRENEKLTDKFAYDSDLMNVFDRKKMRFDFEHVNRRSLDEEISSELKKSASLPKIIKYDSLEMNKGDVINYRRRLAQRFRYKKVISSKANNKYENSLRNSVENQSLRGRRNINKGKLINKNNNKSNYTLIEDTDKNRLLNALKDDKEDKESKSEFLLTKMKVDDLVKNVGLEGKIVDYDEYIKEKIRCVSGVIRENVRDCERNKEKQRKKLIKKSYSVMDVMSK